MELIDWKEKLRSLHVFAEKWKYVWIILLAGLLLMMMGGDRTETVEVDDKNSDTAFSLQQFEGQLKSCLSRIDGIGKVELMLSLDSSEHEVYASDIRRSASESYESVISTVSNGSYGEEPVRVTTNSPKFRGAVIICEGAGSDRVRLAVTEAVGSLCDLGADRIAVIQMQQ